MTTLRPCPFCGNTPKMTKRGESVGMGLFADSFFVGCDECEKNKGVIYCSTHLSGAFAKAEIKLVNYVFADTEEAVILRWNTRPIEDALLEAAEAALKELGHVMPYPGLAGHRITNAENLLRSAIAQAEDAVSEA